MGREYRNFRFKSMHLTSTLIAYFVLNFIIFSYATQNPLVYTRLRVENDFLQVYRNYQREWPYQDRENVKKVKVLEPADFHEHREVEYKYYENEKVDNSSITHDDLVVEALDRTYKSRLIPAYIYNYDNREDKRRSSDKRLLSMSRCWRDLKYLVKNLPSSKRREPISPELDAFYGSFASDEPGLLLGNYHWTGMWRQCYKRQIFDLDRLNNSNSIAFRGRYCMANIRSPSWSEKIKRKTNELLKNGHYFKYPNQQYDYARFFRIQVGFCMPESCDSNTMDWAGNEIKRLALHRLNEPYSSYDLIDVYCIPDETSELRKIEPLGRLFLLTTIIWLLLIILATYIDLKPRLVKKRAIALKSSKNESNNDEPSTSSLDKFASAMSLRRNWERLTETESLSSVKKASSNKSTYIQQHGVLEEKSKQLRTNDLLFLNAFKVIGSPIILFGHIGMFNEQLGRYPLEYDSLNYDWLFHFLVSAVFQVDWFFVMTGFITTYSMFVSKKVERNSRTQWIYSCFLRYWRLAPMYLLLFWFARSVFQHTGSGPVWDYGTTNMTIRSICRRESWFWPLTLTSNFIPLHEECIMPAWYLSNDFQFFILTPPLLILLKKSPGLGWLFGLILIGLSNLLRVHRYWTDPRAQHLDLMRPRYDAFMRNNWDLHPTYLQPQYRIGSYLIGILASHYAYMVLSGQWRSFLYPEGAATSASQTTKSTSGKQKSSDKSSSSSSNVIATASFKIRLLRAILFIIGSSIVMSMSFATWQVKYFFPDEVEPNIKIFATLVYGLHHTYVSIGLSLMFLMLMFGTFQSLRNFLTHPTWTVLSRLSFIIFLIQIEVIYWFDLGSERVVESSAIEVFRRFLCTFCACFMLAICLSLTVELPLAHLERQFIGIHFTEKSSSKSKQQTISKNSSQSEEAAKSSFNQETTSASELKRLVE